MSSTAEEPGAATSGTGAGLIEFLNWTIRKNELVDATAVALRTGCQKVLSVEDDPSGVDLRTANIDSIVSRFRNRHRLDMKERTLDQYDQRFRQSVEMYEKWLDDDPSWKPTQRKRGAGTGGSPKPADRDNGRANGKTVVPIVAPVEPHQPGMITYPFPIRPGIQGKISLPEDLTEREAKRIGAFISTLAIEDEPQPRAILPTHFHNGEE